jgi:hypothetical protein
MTKGMRRQSQTTATAVAALYERRNHLNSLTVYE